MTAYEASSKLWDDFIRESLPLFEPVQDEYNGNLCDGTFEDLLALGTFGRSRTCRRSCAAATSTGSSTRRSRSRPRRR
jgi:hypothetical protein